VLVGIVAPYVLNECSSFLGLAGVDSEFTLNTKKWQPFMGY